MPSKSKKTRKVIICVDDEQIVLNSVAKQLSRAVGNEYDYELAESAEEADEILEEVFADGDQVVMIISDQIMPSRKGDEFLVDTHVKYPEIIKILLTGQAALESAVNAINHADLFRYLTKPWDEKDFALTVSKGLERYELLKKLRDQLRSFQRFVPKEFLESLSLENYESVTPKQAKELHFSVLFTDVRDFTKISEQMGAEKTFSFLNDLFQDFGEVIQKNTGFIDKYIGDAIMAIFKNGAISAVKASIGFLTSLEQTNRLRQHDDIFPIRIGIGINSGKVILGVVGSDQRLDTTVVGDVVNTSSRLEGLTKQLGITLIVPKSIYNEVKDHEIINNCGRLVYSSLIRGKETKIDLYEIFVKDPSESIAVKRKTCKDFERAVHLFSDGKLEESKLLFTKCQKESGDRDPSVFYYLDILEKGADTGKAAEVNRANITAHYQKIFAEEDPSAGATKKTEQIEAAEKESPKSLSKKKPAAKPKAASKSKTAVKSKVGSKAKPKASTKKPVKARAK